ncbi:PilZ domain-containing protein [Noviherbaspirillum sedimenti]|uniref:PilZ domain-containing protein n=1 Tax=Noviherbaspirillum sedimenti TaxID=2320865 RepID=A0A3A3GP60_9BURK|nr:PilZ domain-containing protein [Noviherbaspirillum sedimenti]RJG04116.1 PilZ domain-containing protein [Noviherbaspirillum sedimenti]
MTSEIPENFRPPPELRASSRHTLDVTARMLGHDAIPRPIRITDISRGGIGLVGSTALQHGDTCAIAFDANVNLESRRINVWAKVVYCVPLAEDAYRIGVRFRDYDSHSKMHIEQLCASNGLPVGW